MDPDTLKYEEHIRATRRHQAEREKSKKLELKKNPLIEEYYIDISQVNTFVEDNLTEAPKRGDETSKAQERDEKLIELYGGQVHFEKIRSLEMHIDDHFKSRCQQLKPHYWPVIPINPKPYLNEIRH
jgi:GH25 family lysozyme M1 (1,4-beta-N-acetylmuramidase)